MTRNDKAPIVETTGHEWDGIEELNNPLPRWWLWVLYATIVWGVGYTIAYPAWPLVNGATSGLLGYSTRGDVAAEIAAVEQARSGMMERLAAGGPDAAPAGPRAPGLRGGRGRLGVPGQLRAVPRLGRGGRAGGGLPQPPGRRLALGRHHHGRRPHGGPRRAERRLARRPLVADAGLRRDAGRARRSTRW